MEGLTPLRNSRYRNMDISTEDAIVFLQRNPQYLQHEANPYSVDKLMMLLDNDKLSALEEEFNEHPNGIDLPDFVLLLKSTIVHPPEDKFKLVSGLIKLFQDIDINGDGHMEWSEFTQYIIDAVIGEKDTKFFDARFEKDREFTEHEILDKAYSRKTKRYVMSKTIDNTIHLSLIKKVAYCSHNDLLAVLEEGAKKIKMYTSSNSTIKDTFEPVFEEKAFILDCCYSEKLNMVGCISSDRKVIIWENISVKREPLGSTQDYFSAGIWDSTPVTKKEIVNVKQDVLPTGIWYLENHKVWIVAGADNGLRSFAYGTSDKNPSPYDKAVLLSHTRKITEVTEISIPKLVASSSLDGTIKLWDLADKVLMTELKDGSTSKGIRGITYSFDYGGNLLSFGFENHINIWCPEVSLTRSYVGKLEGHSHTIVCCKFIPGSPNCVSADEKGNIRIWDIRSLTTIQLISAENNSVLVTDLTIIPKHDKFIISGKRMTFYDNSAVSKSIKHFNEDLYPIYCTYNQYYQTIIVLTKIDLRVYDVLTGKLRKVFTDLTDERFNTSDLSSFTFGGKQRKFYIGDNSGLVRVYNMKNGEFIHKVNKFNEEQELDKKKETERKKNSKRRENAEISQIVYLTDEKLLITASWDSTIRIYDESEPDESILLRIMSGGHRESDINAMAYSSHLNLLASGSGNGLISVWDLELGKLDQICLGHTAEITSLQFAEPFPILISGSADGTICVWGVRPCADQYRHKCILRILNSSWKEDGTEIRAGITNLTVETDLRVGVEREKVLKGFPNPQEYYEYVFRPTEKKQQESKLYATNVSKSNYKSSNESEDKEKSYLNTVNEDCRALGIEFLEETLYFPLNRPTDNNDYYETLDDYTKYRETYDTEEKQKKRRCYVYYGDQKGFINLLDLTEVLRKRDIGPCKSEKRTDSYQLRRKEWLDASKQVENQLSNEKLRKTPYSVHTFNTVLLRRWEGHTQPITHIAKVDDPRSIITCSLDKYVKIWSLEGELFGSFNLLKLGKKAWEFPFDWGRHKLREVEDAFTVLNFIEKEEIEALTPEDRELIKFQYLATSFDNENDFLRAVKSYKNYGTYLEKKPETPVKEKEPERKDIEIPAYLQAEIEDKDRERDRIKDKDKNKGKLKGKGKEEKPLQIDTRDPLADYKRNFATEYKGLAQKVLVSIEKFEKQVNKDQKKETQGPTQHQPTKTMSKQKTEIRIRSSKIRGLDPAESIIKIMGGDKKKDEKSTIASRVASSLSKRIGTASQNFRSPGGHLPAIEGTLHEGITTEDVVYNPKGNLTTASRASSARPLFSNFSSKTFKKNLDHATTLVKSYTRPQTHKSAEPDDIKFRQGEGLRSLKIAARKQIEKFDSASPQIFADEREALASRSEFYRNLRSKNNPNTGDAGNLSDRSTGRDDNYKIIANRLFMEDPEKNKMKVLKSNNRLYVL